MVPRPFPPVDIRHHRALFRHGTPAHLLRRKDTGPAPQEPETETQPTSKRLVFQPLKMGKPNNEMCPPMHVETGGKPHRRRGAVNPIQEFPTTATRKGTPLIYLQDRLSGKRFLVDSGATLSLFPHKFNLPPTTDSLSAARTG